MKVLLATDGSECSGAAVRNLCGRPWPAATEVEVLAVAHTLIPIAPDPALVTTAAHVTALSAERERLRGVVGKAVAEIESACPGLKVRSKVLDGSPKRVILEEAERWNAELILVGCHGYGAAIRFVLGSVSHAVALHARCSVEIARTGHDHDAARSRLA